MIADYIEETTTSIAGTNGNGAVTLTQITGLPRFSSVYATATLVRYTIEDTVNLYFEQGIGSVSSNVLTRTTVRVTWNGTTYDDTNPAALAFGSSPTSGNIKIRIAPLADAFIGAAPYHNSTASSIADAGLACGDLTGTNNGNFTMSTDTEVWFPFLWKASGEIVQFALRVGTGVGSTNVKACLNEVNTTGFPGQKLIDFGSVDTSTTGFKTTTSGSWTVTDTAKRAPGYYFIGLIANGAAVINAQTSGLFRASILGPNSAYGGAASRLEKAGSYATGLGSSPAGLSASTSSTRPVVWLKPRN